MLNKQQLEAVKTTEGPLLILAGAGTGKTTVLVNRIAHMLKNEVRPENILAITFTNKAAGELKERIASSVGEDTGNKVWASTFHSMCNRLLKINAKNSNDINPGFTIYDDDDSLAVIKNILKEMGYSKEDANPKTIRYAISALKNEMVDAKTYSKQKPQNKFIDWEKAKQKMEEVVFEEERELFEKVFSEYQSRLFSYNALDFDDIILFTINMFIDNPKLLEKYQNRFRYIMVDEYQDTNHAQYVLVKMLADKVKNIGVVGDDSQAIYSFRGSDFRNILNFGKDYADAKIIKLEENYRCTEVILQAANEVIAHNKKQYKKNLYTSKKGGEKISSELLFDEYEEARFTADEIKKRIRAGKNYEDIAVLCRTNGQSRTFEQQFIREGIPYKLIGGTGFFKRKEIKDMVAYISLIINPNDAIHFERVINFPKRGIGPKSVTTIIQKAKDSSLEEVLRNPEGIRLTKKAKEGIEEFLAAIYKARLELNDKPADILLREFINEVGVVEAIKSSNEEPEKKRDRQSNISQLINMAADMVYRGEGKTLEDFLDVVSLYSDTDEVDDDNAVKLMTVHAAKGLEFPIVFVPGMEEGIFPHERSLQDGETAVEEERRLFYVAITRAKEKLYLTNVEARRVFGEFTSFEPSRFLSEFNINLIQ